MSYNWKIWRKRTTCQCCSVSTVIKRNSRWFIGYKLKYHRSKWSIILIRMVPMGAVIVFFFSCSVIHSWNKALMFAFTTIFHRHVTLPAVPWWPGGWGSDEAAVTSRCYTLTQLLSNLMITILLNYMAFSTQAVQPHSSPLVNIKANEGSMARKRPLQPRWYS